MEMKLELVPIPVGDVDRAKAFYVERLGFVEDVDVRPADGVRVVPRSPWSQPDADVRMRRRCEPELRWCNAAEPAA